MDTAYDRMGRTWLGFGNLSALCWFIGLEQGGTERPEWPTVWDERYGAAEVIDGRGEAGDPNHPTWFSPDASYQKTWRELIRTRLSYAGEATDDAACLRYQRDRFIAADGREALLELSAYARRGLGVSAPRKQFRKERVARLRELIKQYEPEIVVCYGRTEQRDFASICGGLFGADGFRSSGKTLCALTLHPYQASGASPKPQFWIDLGAEMRRRVQQ